MNIKVVLLLMMVLAGCVTVDEKNSATTTAFPLFWPMPPEQPRYAWEGVFQTANDVQLKKNNDDLLKQAIGYASEAKKIFKKPVRVAAANGRVFVTDSMTKSVHVFDAVRRRYFMFGFRFQGALVQPLGVAVDGAGQVYVVDAGRKVIVVYDEMGLWMRNIGDKLGLERPGGIAVSPSGDRVYVTDRDRADSDNHLLWIFDGQGNLLRKVGKRGAEDGEFNYPTDVAVGPDGRVFVLDAGNFRVQIFDREGKFLHKWGQVGRSLGQFARPRTLSVDKDGLIYVVDGAFANIQVFNDTGQLLLPMGTRGMEDGPARFSSPAGIAVDGTGRIFVVDQWLLKVEVLRKLTDAEGKSVLTNGGKMLPRVEKKPNMAQDLQK
ncbi:MAG: 6-bladed beta-propeller [Magnetococcales bacterium]|nr:6-bladed beta-propeller [Magnetococcales bacterium]MBF0437898.1 6-bladed beta-propeller [Magnetococcales bacterium]